jgi:hypothetical protein
MVRRFVGGFKGVEGSMFASAASDMGGPRMDVHGVLDVPDSEEEDSDREVEVSSSGPAA